MSTPPSGPNSDGTAVPVALRLPPLIADHAPPVLALGAFLKATVTYGNASGTVVSGDIGNLDGPDAAVRLEQTARTLVAEGGLRPALIAHDLHPDFHSTRLARQLADEWGCQAIGVQHHAAHMGAVMAENPVASQAFDQAAAGVIGLALDGFGLGLENQSWGGEVIRLQPYGTWARPAGLALLAQPGGDVAARQPWRMAVAALHRLGRRQLAAPMFGDLPQIGRAAVSVLGQMLDKGLNSPFSSSCGRLFDAACGLLGVVPVATFEGEAPMALEKLVTQPVVMADGWRISPDGSLCLDPLMGALADLAQGQSVADLSLEVQTKGANLFHGTLAAALVDWLVWHREPGATGGHRPVYAPLGGGCFFNAVLGPLVAQGLSEQGFHVLRPQALSPGDPAVSVGQAWLAARSLPSP